MLRRLAFVFSVLLLATACPKIERKVYTFDLATKTGEVRFINIVSDDPNKANNDFMDLVNKVIKGSQLEEDNPGWKIASKDLIEAEGRLDGVVKFSFDDLGKIGIYQHDKKSPYIFCVNHKDSEKLLSTNGKRIDDTLKGCVAWDRKSTKLEVTVKTHEMMGNEKTLLPQFQKWSKGEELELTQSPLSGLGMGLPGAGGGGAGEGFGEALAGELMGSITGALGLAGTMTPGKPAVDGPMEPDAVEAGVGEMKRQELQMCYQVVAKMSPGLTGEVVLGFTVDTTGEVIDPKVTDSTFTMPGVEECLEKRIDDVKFATPPKEKAKVAWPLKFSP